MFFVNSQHRAGLPLGRAVRAGMERAFDCDFSGVRWHISPLAKILGVRAFACGSDLYFAPRQYQPAEPAGQRLLGHELAHVVQQRLGRVTNPFGTGIARVDDPYLEDEATRWGDLAAQGRLVMVDSAAALEQAGRSALLTRPGAWQGPPLVLQCEGNDEAPDARQVEAASWPNVLSKHKKKIVKGFASAAGVGIQSAQIATNTGLLALALGTAGAASATGIGLAAAGGALTLGLMVTGAVSAHSTNKHLHLLEQVYEKRKACMCELIDNEPRIDDHNYIADTILPWIIRQKKHKFRKKVGSAAGGGLIVSAISAIRWLHKKRLGTLGQKRSFYAQVLAVHLLTFQCSLVTQIVAALSSPQKLVEMLDQDSNTITPEIAEKMKSV